MMPLAMARLCGSVSARDAAASTVTGLPPLHAIDQQGAKILRVLEIVRIGRTKPRIGHFKQLGLHRQRCMVAGSDAVLDKLKRAHKLIGLQRILGKGRRCMSGGQQQQGQRHGR